MPIFRIDEGKLKQLNVIPLDKERNLQRLLEANLMSVLELHFLATEYETTIGGRIDTIAVDTSGAPVIIEYKRNKNDNVINQALSYLKWLKTQKPEFFEKLIIDKLGKAAADAIKLDWKNPRVICIAESYSKFDIDTVEVVPLRIELMRYRYYDGNVFSLESVNVTEPSVTQPMQKASKQVAAVENSALELLREKASKQINELFGELRERILALDESISERANTLYVAYRMAQNFAHVHLGKNQLKISLRPIIFVDPKKLVEKIPEGYNWTMNRRIYLQSADELEYVMGIIEQSYKNVL